MHWQNRGLLLRIAVLSSVVAVALGATSGAASADTVGPLPPLPPASLVSKSGPHLCEFNAVLNVPQAVSAGFYGIRSVNESDGTETVQSDVILNIANGGCGLHTEVTLQTRVCTGLFGSCHWAVVATKKYETLDLPTYGSVTTGPLVAPLRRGANSYKVHVDVTSYQQIADEGPMGAKFGAIGLEEHGDEFDSPTVKVTY